MAGGGGCGSGSDWGCSREQDQGESQCIGCSCSPAGKASNGGGDAKSRCIKCKEAAAVALANQTEPMCASCLRAGVLAKFKTVLNNYGLVSAQDRILLAFSGGSASRVALEFLCEIKSEALASRALNAPTFDLGVAFVDEGLALGISLQERQAAANGIRSIVSGLSVSLHVVPLEDVFSNSEADDDNSRNQKQLQSLLDFVKDRTGKEDLVETLRMNLLEQVAQKNGYTKMVLGLSTTRISSRVVSATAKGEGFSLAAGVQYVDARWHAPVVLPLRDCATKELALLCHLFHLETLFLRNFSTLEEAGTTSSINSLCNSFVSTLLQDNSARDHMIVRTAAKLTPFSFNQLVLNANSPYLRKRRGSKQGDANGKILRETLCAICRAPLDEREFSDAEMLDNVSAQFRSACCPSCKSQIFAQDDDHLHGLLPKHIQMRRYDALKSKQSWMRSQIEEFLIPEDPEVKISIQ